MHAYNYNFLHPPKKGDFNLFAMTRIHAREVDKGVGK